MTLALLFILMLSGCDEETVTRRLLCKDGVVYYLEGGIWIETKLYSGNKCIPIKHKKKASKP